MYYAIYTILGWLFTTIALPIYVVHCALTRKSLISLKQRFGFFEHSTSDRVLPSCIWIHAASVGEVQVAKALVNELKKKQFKGSVVLTTVTEQGQNVARKQFGKEVYCLYAPVDLPWIVNKFLNKLSPTVYICLETELWPNILRLTKKNGIPTILLNGRMSENSYNNYRKFPFFMSQVVECFNEISTIQPVDKARYVSLGVEAQKVHVFGNAKYDLHLDTVAENAHDNVGCYDSTNADRVIAQCRHKLQINDQHPVLVAGSTHTGEEFEIAKAFLDLKKKIPQLILIIAPRHLQRLEKITEELNRLNLRFQKLSHAKENCRTKDIIVVDSMGELMQLYSLATYIFCGGSLVERGGHNIMEAAIWGKAPFYGPHMQDFEDARIMLEEQDAGFMVQSSKELAERILHFEIDQEKYRQASKRAKEVAQSQQGAASNQLGLVTKYIH